ncbi:MAG: winged helix-turn-helix domain-containing protein, partial [Fimbriimonadaceae bacterium]|nr:winged helix-turn-helix domain-containing protein [Fimbriimonadaceae bacterium]
LLVVHAGKVLTHRYLLTQVWGPQAIHQTHYLRVHVAHLREKVEPDPEQPRLIFTESGIGYRLVAP